MATNLEHDTSYDPSRLSNDVAATSEQAAPEADRVPPAERVFDGVHAAFGQTAERIEPALDRMAEHAEVIGARVGEEVRQLTELPGSWMDDCRASVRSRPVVALAVAFAVGGLLAGMTRR